MTCQTEKLKSRNYRIVGCVAAAVCLTGLFVVASVDRDGSQRTELPANQSDIVSDDHAYTQKALHHENVRRPNNGVEVADFKIAATAQIQLCQACGPFESPSRVGVDCQGSGRCQQECWSASRPIPWQSLAQGEYVGPARTAHVDRYHVRVGDQIEFIYRRKREMTSTPYRLNVGDKIRVESLTDDKINRELEIQLDGYITLPPAFQVRAAGKTVKILTAEIEKEYETWYKVPAITVTPIDTQRRLQDLLKSVDSTFGNGGLRQETTVTPEGTIQLPGIGNVMVQGLTLDELGREVEERYAQLVPGIGINPRLIAQAPHFMYVGGEVRTPNQYQLTGPTTAIMAVAMAGGWNYGANLREIVVLRRAEDWRLIATKIDLHDALLGKAPCPDGNIWLRDSDIVYVPQGKLLLKSNFLDLFFTKGLYRIIPLNASYNVSSTIN